MNLQNKSVVLNIVFAIVVVVLSVRLASDKATVDKSADAHQSVNAEQAVLDNIATRTSVRDYEARPVEKEKIEKMLRAAMAAPTAMNKQPWHFVVVDQRNVLDALAGTNPYAKMLKKAPLAIVVCGNTDKMIEVAVATFGFKTPRLLPKTFCLQHTLWDWEQSGLAPIHQKSVAFQSAKYCRCPTISSPST